jgi:hypothetical protein
MDHFMTDEKLVSIHFDSIVDYMETKPCRENADLHKKLTGRIVSESSPKWMKGWYGPSASSYQEVTNLGLVGDKELFNSLQEKVDRLREHLGMHKRDYSSAIKQARRVRERAAQGDELDIHSVYQGRLDVAWGRTKRIEMDHETKLVTLLIDNEDNAEVNAADTLWRSAVAVLLTEELEAAGKSVRIITYGGSTRCFVGTRKECTVTITIKEYNTSLSLDRLAAMTHIGFGRGPGFVAMAMQPYKVQPHLGGSVSYSDRLIPLQLRPEIEKGHTKVVYLGKANHLHTAASILSQRTNELTSKERVA